MDATPEANSATCINATTSESATTHEKKTARKSGNTHKNGTARKNGTVRKNRDARKSEAIRKNGTLHGRSNGSSGGGSGGTGGGEVPVANWDPDCRRGARYLNMDARNAVGQTEELDDDEFDSLFAMSNNNGDNLEERSPIHEKQVLGIAARQLLLKIEASCKKVLSDRHQCEAFKVIKSLVHGLQLQNLNTAFRDESLLSLIRRCGEAEVNVSQAVFTQMLDFIHFRVKFERSLFCYYQSSMTDQLHTSVLKMTLPTSSGEPGPQKYQPHQLLNHAAKQAGTIPKTIGRYVSKGSVYSLLGGAGALFNIFLESNR